MISKILKGGLLGALLFAGTTAFAQSKNEDKPKLTIEQKADQKVAKMDGVLNLTPAQEASIKNIVVKYWNKKQEDRKNNGNDQEKLNTLVKERHEAQRKEINAVLTVEQRKLWQEEKEEQKEEHNNNTPKYNNNNTTK